MAQPTRFRPAVLPLVLLCASPWNWIRSCAASPPPPPSPLPTTAAELELEVVALTRRLAEAQVALQYARQGSGPAQADPEGVPPGAYLASCSGCKLYGETLDCSCTNANGGRQRSSIAPWVSCDTPLNLTNEKGFLTCDWTDVPPPRVGNLTYFGKPTLPDIDKTCRTLEATTFFAPQVQSPPSHIPVCVCARARGL